MAADERLQYAMAAECDERAVVGVRCVVVGIIRREAVVKVGGVVLRQLSA